MGIDINVYAVMGTKVDWDDSFSDAYDAVYDDHDTPEVIMDGMCGEYMVFGQLLWDSGNFRWGVEEGSQFMKIDMVSLPKIEAEYKQAFVKKFPTFADYMDRPFDLLVFTHVS